MLVIGELRDMIAALRRDHENLGAKIDALQVLADCGDDPAKYAKRIGEMSDDDYARHTARLPRSAAK